MQQTYSKSKLALISSTLMDFCSSEHVSLNPADLAASLKATPLQAVGSFLIFVSCATKFSPHLVATLFTFPIVIRIFDDRLLNLARPCCMPSSVGCCSFLLVDNPPQALVRGWHRLFFAFTLDLFALCYIFTHCPYPPPSPSCTGTILLWLVLKPGVSKLMSKKNKPGIGMTRVATD